MGDGDRRRPPRVSGEYLRSHPPRSWYPRELSLRGDGSPKSLRSSSRLRLFENLGGELPLRRVSAYRGGDIVLALARIWTAGAGETVRSRALKRATVSGEASTARVGAVSSRTSSSSESERAAHAACAAASAAAEATSFSLWCFLRAKPVEGPYSSSLPSEDGASERESLSLSGERGRGA